MPRPFLSVPPDVHFHRIANFQPNLPGKNFGILRPFFKIHVVVLMQDATAKRIIATFAAGDARIRGPSEQVGRI
jgi:hypothetical protein